MSFPIASSLLDAVVLSICDKEISYGYKITQEVRSVMDISESTLYPVLRRLLKDNRLETFDEEFAGRNRRYYKITPLGKELLTQYKQDWLEYRKKVNNVLLEGENE